VSSSEGSSLRRRALAAPPALTRDRILDPKGLGTGYGTGATFAFR